MFDIVSPLAAAGHLRWLIPQLHMPDTHTARANQKNKQYTQHYNISMMA